MRHDQRYTATARWLHWLMVLLIAAAVPVGLWMVYFEPRDETFKLQLYDLHEGLGFTLVLLLLLRVAVRLSRPAPPMPGDTPALVRLLARLNHFGLYVVLLAQPVLGFLATNAWGFPFHWWGVLPIPSPIGRDEALAPILSALHWYGAMLLVTMVAAHLLGVAYHAYVRRDGLLRRML
ncbi:cytochrome b [Limobrevibacterium gyesilva]|uniref:Cytochrome b/b6 domain-containing protein n=1 Tax=Limobrevibacterium gyesilva TaxID=2991712 RepID=A0AA41YNU4_9PROT|nr:cytochrome b/b6 domain-containing protein [Limobrevibacterium gyesilva]